MLKPSVEIDFKDNELYIIDGETGFVGTGNKCSYQVLEIIRQANTESDIIEKLKTQYNESQYPRIEKSIPKIINWALEREIICVSEE
jgi:hypothetical protein